MPKNQLLYAGCSGIGKHVAQYWEGQVACWEVWMDFSEKLLVSKQILWGSLQVVQARK